MVNSSANLIKKYNRAMVTGAAGFIGSHLVEELLSIGLMVIAIDDFSAGHIDNLESFSSNSNLQIAKCDVSDYSALRVFFSGVDIVFHNAASKKNICLIDPSRDLDVNGRGALNIMLLAKEYGVKKVIHASSGSVYGEPVQLPIDESHPLRPTSYYGVSKLAGERYVDVFHNLYGINTTVLRYFHVYGARQESHPELGGVVSIFIKNLLEGKTINIHGDGNQLRSFTYVKDVVRANILAAVSEESNGEVYNVASGIKITINELLNVLKANLELKGKESITQNTESLVGDIRFFDVNNQKIKRLGLDFTSFEKGIHETIKSMKHESK
jgi:nucleoside-diphosphate-sugar epimerase